MNFYERCIQLRNHYLQIDPDPLKLSILSKLVAYSFYNYKHLDDLPVGETIYISCFDLSENFRKIYSDLKIVLLDLGYKNVNINNCYFRESHSICFIIIP